jgi:hypothetical protein
MRVKWTTTAAAAGSFNYKFMQLVGLACVQNDVVSAGVWMTLVSGSLTGLTTIALDIVQRTSGGTDVATLFGANLKSTINGTRTRIAREGVTITAATTANARAQISGSFPSAASFSFEIEFSWLQIEKRATLSSPTTGARPADALTLKLPAAGTKDLTLTFDNDSQQVIPSVAGGDYAIDPAILDRPRVKTIDWGSV